MRTLLRVPAATYRLQFNQKFRFADARALVPYLQALGVTDLYASPLLAARRGSPHGYDVTDPARLNPELGNEKEFAALAGELQQRGMGLLLDIVPNHMAASSENPWWADVLKNGPESPYAAFFDIDWNPEAVPGLANKVLVPVLGAPYGEALENQELTVALAEDGFWLCYHELRFPLNHTSSVRILEHGLKRLASNPGLHHPAAAQLLDLIAALKKPPGQTEGEHPAVSGKPAEAGEHKERERAAAMAPDGEPGKCGEAGEPEKKGGTPGSAARRQTVWENLWRLYNGQPEIKVFLDENLRIINGRKGDPESFNLLDRIIREQFYRLAFWRTAKEDINYRRFFDVSDLVSLRMEEEKVFAATHALILRLAAAGQLTGLRIDHIDGLYDPQAYLNWLQESLPKGGAAGVREAGTAGQRPNFYVVAEKILSNGEELPSGWPVCGTTGYDFLNLLNGLFVDGRGAASLDELYARMGGPETEKDFAAVVYLQKKKVMAELFASEVNSLARSLARLAQADRHGCDFTLSELKEALAEITACLPVYRTYIRGFAVTDRDRRYIESAVREAVRRRPAARPACTFLHRLLRLEFPGYLTAGQKEERLRFVMRWQQFTGPIMAKGFEDTALYVYSRLVSLNEVGGDPGRTAGISVAEFHRRNQFRQTTRPYSLNATSTHDTKRSEDVRARINVLSEISAAWTARVEQWHRWNHPRKPVVNGVPVPDGNTELFIYQTLIGAWPLCEEEVPSFFRERLRAYLVKAAREAKICTSWLAPDAAYERALEGFVAAILEPSPENRFLPDFLKFQKVTAFYGAVNSLAQVLLKIASPGVPDFYQGTELWNFSLVDPDNRRPVDFQARTEMLTHLQKIEEENERREKEEKQKAEEGEEKAAAASAERKSGEEGGDQPPLARKLLDSWEDGRVKLYLTYKALCFRRTYRELFAAGEYLPIEAAGPRAGYICAFVRRLENTWVLAAAPRLAALLIMESKGLRALCGKNDPPPLPPLTFPLGEAVWGETSLLLPAYTPARWRNILTGATVQTATAAATRPHPSGGSLPQPDQKTLPLAEVFRNFPVVLLAGISESE